MQCAVDGFDIGNALFDGTYESNGRADAKLTLLMHGSADKICDVEGSREIAKQNQNVESFIYREWDGYYHEIHNGGPEADGSKVIETIRDFVLD